MEEREFFWKPLVILWIIMPPYSGCSVYCILLEQDLSSPTFILTDFSFSDVVI
jgi:hypothetical protein